jgi:hypothetical protein
MGSQQQSDGGSEMSFEERLASFSSPSLQGLRPAQLRALATYDEVRSSSTDIGIELPTGAGKTLIALLIADQALEEGRTVAYLTGTKQLAEQAVEQALLLPGLDVELFYSQHYPAAALQAYNQARAVGIMNYWVYFNSRPRVEPADLVIFDDAHLAEQALSGMFTLRIPRGAGGGTDLFCEICDLILQLAPESYPSLQALRDGAAPRNSPPELISFVDWAAVAASVEAAIDGSQFVAGDRDAGYSWQAIRAHLKRCGVLIGPAAIEIRPYHIPAQTVTGYLRSKQRVYLSATLGQSGDIQRRLGVNEVVAAATASDAALAELGKRTFLINPTQDATLSPESWAFAMKQVQAAAADGDGRVAWLCSSHSEADEVQARLTDAGSTVFRLRAGDDPSIDQWRRTPNAHLVTAGRFDGLDFPDDICRLVIIPSVPSASTEFERFVVAYLGDASYMRYRIGQRVTQGLGRANRTANDSALYIGLDPGFGPILADASVQAALGRDVCPVVTEALQYHGDSWQRVTTAANSFWRTHRHPAQPVLEEPVAAVRNRPGRAVGSTAQGESALHEVAAITRLWLGDNADAAQKADEAAQVLRDAGELEHAAFWQYVQAHALFDRGRPTDVASAKQAIEAAVTSAPQTAWFVRLKRTIDTLAGTTVDGTTHDTLFLSWDEWIREAGSKVQRQVAKGRQLLEGTHDQRCEGLAILARLCGADADRPTGQSATDARWVWASPRKGQRRVWEVKTGDPDRVPRDDINQVLGQVQEEQMRNPLSRVVGCLLTTLDEIEPDAARAAMDKVVLVNLDAALALYDAMAERFMSYFTAYGTGTALERGSARQATEPRLPPGDWLHNLLSPRRADFLTRADIDPLFLV